MNDEFSCCDEYGNWYRSTCLKVNETENQDVDGNTIISILVAFRYLDPQGQKEDEMGRKCTGWIS